MDTSSSWNCWLRDQTVAPAPDRTLLLALLPALVVAVHAVSWPWSACVPDLGATLSSTALRLQGAAQRCCWLVPPRVMLLRIARPGAARGSWQRAFWAVPLLLALGRWRGTAAGAARTVVDARAGQQFHLVPPGHSRCWRWRRCWQPWWQPARCRACQSCGCRRHGRPDVRRTRRHALRASLPRRQSAVRRAVVRAGHGES